MSLYLDASVLVPLLRDEAASPEISRFAREASDVLLVSDLARGEVVSALARLVRMGELAEADARYRLDTFTEWLSVASEPLSTESADVRLAADFVAHFALGLRMPDAIHIAACESRGLTLVCGDRRMASAARELGVVVMMLE